MNAIKNELGEDMNNLHMRNTVFSNTHQLGVIMPVYNEHRTISSIVERVLVQSCVTQLVIVDDASTDHGWEQIQRWVSLDNRVKAVRHTNNRGKGAAIRTGLEHVLTPIVIIQDADLEYNPADYVKMLNLILQDEADVVYGSRFIETDSRNPRWHTFGNRVLTFISNLATGLRLSDEATCYKMFRTKILSQLVLHEDGFGFCPEVTAKISKLGVRIYEVPISYTGRGRKEGKKIRLRDGWNALSCILKYNFLHKRF